MVDIVTGLPPADGKAAAKISDEHANERVHNEDVGNGPVPSIVCGEHDLVLAERSVNARAEERAKGADEPKTSPGKLPR